MALVARCVTLCTMRRRLPHRLMAAFAGLWFALTTLSPVPLLACPMHMRSGAQATPSVRTGGHGHDCHAAVHQGPATPHQRGEHGACSSNCCCVAPVALRVGRLVLLPIVPDRLSVVAGLTLSILKLSDLGSSVLPAVFTLQKVIWCGPSPETEKGLPV